MSNSNKKATPKKTAAPKMTAVKSATKSAPKATPAKKTAVKAAKPAKPAKSTGNKELDKMLAVMTEAKKKGEKSVVVFTTNRGHHKAKLSNEGGFGANDLKPKFYEAYKHMLCKHDIITRLVNPNEFAVEWIVKF